jgi:hypothetical protein
MQSSLSTTMTSRPRKSSRGGETYNAGSDDEAID